MSLWTTCYAGAITSRQHCVDKCRMLTVLSIFLTKMRYFMPNKVYQTKSFPRRQFGKNVIVNRSFQTAWSDGFKWLNCDTRNGFAFCFVCCKAVRDGKVSLLPNAEERFLFNQRGNRVYRNFKVDPEAMQRRCISWSGKHSGRNLQRRDDVMKFEAWKVGCSFHFWNNTAKMFATRWLLISLFTTPYNFFRSCQSLRVLRFPRSVKF